MKKKYYLEIPKGKKFVVYFNGHDVTEEWLNHFSGLSSEQERRCVKLFIPYILRRHPKWKLQGQRKLRSPSKP